MRGTVVTGPLPALRSRPTGVKVPGLRYGLLAVWFVLSMGGIVWMAVYQFSPGRSEQAPYTWPQASAIARNDQGGTLLMFLHPCCPCSRASLDELLKICSRCPDNVTPCIVFFKPADADEAWDQSDLWDLARAIPRAQVIRDEGNETRLFRAQTSGHTLLYDADGQLRFSGGITSSRGHAGDNSGRSAIESFLIHGKAGIATTPVFGCPILDESAP